MPIGHLAADLLSMEEDNVSSLRLQQLYPSVSFPRNPVDETFGADYPRLVVIRNTTRPAVDLGDEVVKEPAAKLGDGFWHQQWSVTPASGGVIAALKVTLQEQALQIADRKTFPMTFRENMIYCELHRAEAGVPPVTVDNYPQLAAVMSARSFTMPQTLAEVRRQLDTWNARAAAVTLKLEDIKIRINAASTGAELKILIDELEAFV